MNSLEKKNGHNNVYKVAMHECYNVCKKMSLRESNQPASSLMLYYVSRFAGIACLIAAKKNAPVKMFSVSATSGIVSVRTEAGVFYKGEAINRYLYKNADSIWNHLAAGYGVNPVRVQGNLEQIVENCAKNYGNKNFRVWNGQASPYVNRKDACKVYMAICSHLAKYELSEEQMVHVYGELAQKTIKDVKKSFPKNVNPLFLAMENAVFSAHMSVDI